MPGNQKKDKAADPCRAIGLATEGEMETLIAAASSGPRVDIPHLQQGNLRFKQLIFQ